MLRKVYTAQELSELFVRVSGNEKLKVEFAALKDAGIPTLLTISEESRRMEEMMKLYSMQNGSDGAPSFPLEYTLTLNTGSELIGRIEGYLDTDSERAELIAAQIYRLSLLSQRKLNFQLTKPPLRS